MHLEIVIWLFDTLANNFEINIHFTKYLKESWLMYSDEYFSYKYFHSYTFALKISAKLSSSHKQPDNLRGKAYLGNDFKGRG